MVSDEEGRLERARRRVETVGTCDLAALAAAQADVYEAERALARSRHQPYAEIMNLGAEWNVGAPEPHLVCNGLRAFIVCFLGEPDPSWDGTTTTIVAPADEHEDLFAIIDVWGLASVRFGSPNDEALSGHPLWGRGLEPYRAHRVTNSGWLEEHIRWNSVHPFHSEATWRELDHYLLAFHDDMIEALGRGIEATTARGTMNSLLADCLDKLIHEPTRR